jgi:hypothetical protein
MSPWLFALLNKSRVQVTQTYSANATWTAPLTTSSIDTASGKGAAGTPGQAAYDDPSTTNNVKLEQYYYRRIDGGPDDTSTIKYNNAWSGTQPDNTSETGPISDGVHYEVTLITTYFVETTPGAHHDAIPPTTGASTTAFGKTFPGGTGGAASTTTFSNIAVTPGGSYSIVVPSGGLITFTYWQ